ncbi:MAG: type II toxin-antitoxin system VapC family toxin [Candidatus Acidiferrales bacterium]
MAEFVLDASVAFSWCFPGDPTEDTPYSRRILSKLATDDALVPEIWAFEFANIIFIAFNRRKRISQKQIDEYLIRLKALPIRVEFNDVGRILHWNHKRENGICQLMMRPILIWRYEEKYLSQRRTMISRKLRRQRE